MSFASALIIPIIFLIVSLLLLFSKKPLFDAFLEGAREGFHTCVGLLPTLVILLAAVSMFNASGAAGLMSGFLSPVLGKIGVPSDIASLIIVRPISGSASTALLSDLLGNVGADSFSGLCASVIAGSSDTIIYILALYFGSVRVTHTRHAFVAAILTMIFIVFISCITVRIIL